MNGVEEAVIKRAEDLILLQARGGDLVTACADLDDKDEMDVEQAVSLTMNINEHL